MHNADTKSSIFQSYVVTGRPILRYDVLQQTILTITYWWHHLLSNGGNLFILLCIMLNTESVQGREYYNTKIIVQEKITAAVTPQFQE